MSLKTLAKKSPLVGGVYQAGMRRYLTCLQKKHPIKPKQIMFSAYTGRQFADTPKAAFDLLTADPAYADFTFIWAFEDVDAFDDPRITEKVDVNSKRYWEALVESKYWICNASIERLVPVNLPGHQYLQFWHGIPMKTLGRDEKHGDWVVKNWYNNTKPDVIWASGAYDTDIFRHVFPSAKLIEPVGQLRKWQLEQADPSDLREQLRLTGDKPVLLYAPTFRDGEVAEHAYLDQWTFQQLAAKYQIVYRGHYFTGNDRDPLWAEIVIANDVPLPELMKLADVLVTDYSSILFDYASLGRPIYLYQADLEAYQEERGLYLTGHDLHLPVAKSRSGLVDTILNRNYDQEWVTHLAEEYDPMPMERTVEKLKAFINEEEKENDESQG